jgi:hypothetical protein
MGHPNGVRHLQTPSTARTSSSPSRRPTTSWGGLTGSYAIKNQEVDVGIPGGPIYWKTAFGANQEAAMTLTKIDSRGVNSLFLKGNADTT